ncbi:metallophosphoesterase [uncultured Sphaerochaeta sp.]|uniref:metallophosphoesterase family protein n=1 Tax=uncultured Sphaerochaeta sp. TaxID=886478 RepID=UPI002A0A4361|nr:metallophosphoesterase [uncultured Sphaerochaeta sp.]
MNKYFFPLTILSLVLCTACDLPSFSLLENSEATLKTNTFELQASTEMLASCSFLLMTDQHFTRQDTGVWYAQDTFFSWLQTYQETTAGQDARHLDLMLSLGDVTEDSREIEFSQYSQFLAKLKTYGIETHSIKGNHDIRSKEESNNYWDTYVQEPLFQAFSYHGVSFYLLDTSCRTLGITQREKLERALAKDGQPKIFLTHMPLYGKPTLLYYCLPDTQEREEILRIMNQYSVGLYISGHHHQGDITYRFTDTLSEFVAGAFNGRTSLVETTLPRWYICSFDASTSVISITRYAVHKSTLSVDSTLLGTFILP